MTQTNQAKDIIDNLRPYINQDGGDIEFVEVKNNIVYVRLAGACVGCGLIDSTIKDGVEQIVKQEMPDIIAVEVIM
ncbi:MULTISPECIES: NifU family protein [Spiroplasma]|uniref:Nitrogen-fixing protein NifU n=4 Tax=Spiroplasma TaxID=2132 RepID=A0AAI9X0V5_SPIME|nr:MULTISPECIES: NifU family protein [Spiroplasma]ALA98359.1 NifU-like domain-containing protein [Spiroplasma kunkelii CR2-3x]APE74123.1 NifU-like domain-containing protein [Spiroplasma citri]ELL44480.1 NifU-like domain-containing protein [Spiroplasma melliferum IPMB4A]KAI92409.1 nitrogen-fixing protein NifU [Spiroplasma melliferum KC3]QCO23387.1 NifU-like domain-containing protein [Spiroplasma melliferum]